MTDERFKKASYCSKLLYGILLDRMGLSIQNEWFDNENREYIIYTIDEVMKSMNCCKGTAFKFLAELEDIGLIDRNQEVETLEPNNTDINNTEKSYTDSIIIQRLCLSELIPIKKPQAYYDTLKFVNLIGDLRYSGFTG